MPYNTLVVIAVVVVGFTAFGLVLAYVQWITGPGASDREQEPRTAVAATRPRPSQIQTEWRKAS